MIKLRFPKVGVPSPEVSAPGSLTPPRPALILLRRREFLKALGAVLILLATPVTSVQRAWAAARGRFFTPHERATLEALCDRIIPPDADPGAKALGAATYIERLLTAFDHHPVSPIYAGGPFSNRNPYPNNADGTPSTKRPHDSFKRFVPLTRLQELRWRAEIVGSESLYAGKTDELSMALQALDDAHGGPLKGLRDVYRDGLAKIDTKAQTVAGGAFVGLTSTQQDQVLAAIDGDPLFPPDPRRGENFLTLLIRHTLEGCFSAPEYGGNKSRGGWKMIGSQGDVQPLGYSIFSKAKNDYNERADLPMSTPDPDELDSNGMVNPKPLSADGTAILDNIALLSGILGDGCEVS